MASNVVDGSWQFSFSFFLFYCKPAEATWLGHATSNSFTVYSTLAISYAQLLIYRHLILI